MEAILALDSNNGLSKQGIIPWKSDKDLKFFYETTKNNVVIMGRNTYLSLPDNARPLKNRLNVILTNHAKLFENESNKNTIFTDNLSIYNDILQNREKYCGLYPSLSRNFKIFIIGGKQIYEHFIPLCEVVWITRIKNCYSCDLTIDINLDNRFREKEYYEDDEIKISTFEKGGAK